ncbi:MAG: ElyC/SanA/YdcF family protein, partial [Cyclobacteriaceae bacterium]
MLRQLFYFFLLVILFVVVSNVWIVNSTSGKVYSNYDSLSNHKVALVLGTSHLLTSGAPNPFFDNRMETAAALFKNGKVKHFIVSGDNRTKYYNEPLEMKRALVKLGIPSSAI